MLKSRSNRIVIALIVAAALFLFALILGFNQRNVIAGGGLPPRPEPTATPLPSTQSVPNGALIELNYDGIAVGPQGVWTVVEWQDTETLKWHDVQGWQGTVELDGTQQWWVAPADIGKGPFRWVIYDAEDGNVLQTSEEFNLPASEMLITVVTVSVTDAQ